MCNNVVKRMDEMSKSAQPWFRLSPLVSESPESVAQPVEHTQEHVPTGEPRDDKAAEARHKIRTVLARGGGHLLVPQFVKELRRLLHDQEAVLKVINSDPTWALPVLNRQYYAIRNAADVLGLHNLANVASRAEVLANLLDTGILKLAAAHARVLIDTHGLLVELVSHVAKCGSDKECYPITRTALWMYSLLDPSIGEYEPGQPKPPSHLQ